MEKTSDIVVIILRFLFGVVLAAIVALFLVLWLGIPVEMLSAFVLVIGVLSVFWGDNFLKWFMSIFKFLR